MWIAYSRMCFKKKRPTIARLLASTFALPPPILRLTFPFPGSPGEEGALCVIDVTTAPIIDEWKDVEKINFFGMNHLHIEFVFLF